MSFKEILWIQDEEEEEMGNEKKKRKKKKKKWKMGFEKNGK